MRARSFSIDLDKVCAIESSPILGDASIVVLPTEWINPKRNKLVYPFSLEHVATLLGDRFMFIEVSEGALNTRKVLLNPHQVKQSGMWEGFRWRSPSTDLIMQRICIAFQSGRKYQFDMPDGEFMAAYRRWEDRWGLPPYPAWGRRERYLLLGRAKLKQYTLDAQI